MGKFADRNSSKRILGKRAQGDEFFRESGARFKFAKIFDETQIDIKRNCNYIETVDLSYFFLSSFLTYIHICVDMRKRYARIEGEEEKICENPVLMKERI